MNNNNSIKTEFGYIETCELDRGFSDYFKANLRPTFEDLEATRLSLFAKIRIRLLISIFIFLIITGLLFALNIFRQISASNIGIILPGGSMAYDFIHFLDLLGYLILFISALLYWTFLPSTQFNKNLKNVILPHITNFIQDCRFTNDSEIDENQLFDSLIFPSLIKGVGIINNENRGTFIIYSDDNILGVYKDTGYDLTELEIKKFHSSRYNLNIFKGYFITIECKKNFQKKTVITYSSNILFNFFYKFKYWRNGLKPVRLEDPEFNRIFKVYSEDQIESRFLLTPTFMDRLYKLALLYKKHNQQSYGFTYILLGELFKRPIELIGQVFPNFANRFRPIPRANHASLIQASFYRQKIIIAVPSMRELFEFNVIDEPISSNSLSTVFQEIKIVYDIIDDLKLYQNIGL